MWSNSISIAREYDREIGYILDSLQSTKDLSYAIEESRDRLFVYVASACENRDSVERRIYEIAHTVILSFFKLRFFMSKLPIRRLSHAYCALLGAIVNFDRDFETGLVDKVFSKVSDFNMDGVTSFRLRPLLQSWQELSEVSGKLIEGISADPEIFEIASFITGSESGKNQLIIKSGNLKNITRHENVEVVNLLDNDEYNLLLAILKERPGEILLENCKLSNPMHDTLKRLARVIEK